MAAAHIPSTQSTGDQPRRLDLPAGVAALALPGLGHFIRGERARAGGIAAGVIGLFMLGLIVGGLASVDSTSERTETRITYWLGQIWVGPIAWGANQIHQSAFKLHSSPTAGGTIHIAPGPNEVIDNGGLRDRQPSDPAPPTRSVGRMHELGVLAALLAGMLNLIAILDALLPGRARRASGSEKKGGDKKKASASGSRDPAAAEPETSASSAIDRVLAGKASPASTTKPDADGGRP